MKLKHMVSAMLLISLVGCGGGSGSSSESATTKPASNNPPVANNDAIEVGMNVSTELDVLANDSDVDSFTLASVTEASNGSVLQNDHNIIYTPTDGFVGNDNFSYTIKDSIGQEATATVNLTVYNIPPTAVDDIVQTQQSSNVEIDVLANDLSVGKHQLTVTSTSVPAHGSVELIEGILTYTPTSGFVGEDSFIYIIEDSLGDEATARVSVNIANVIPTTNDDEASIKQNESITVDVLGNDSDALGDVLTISALDGVNHGNASIENNKIVYNPTPGYAGNETINYTVNDGYDGQSEAKLTISIDNVEPIASDDSVYTLKNKSIAIDVLANDKDVIDDTLTIQTVSAALHGNVTIVDGKLNYQPITDYVGDDEFEYTLVDSHGASDSSTVTVKVGTAINLQGKVVGYQQSGLEVAIKLGEQELTTTTDEQGNYAIELQTVEPDSLLIAYVDNAAENYNLRAYLGDLASLLADVDENDNFVIHKNITDLTTAEYELIDVMHEGHELNNIAELIDAQYDADSFYLLQMTIAAMLVNQDNGLTLPGGFTTVNEFIKSTEQMNQQMAVWREYNSALYHQAYTDLATNSELSRYPSRLTQGHHLLVPSTALRNTNSGLYYPINIALSEDGGNYSDSIGNVNISYDWQQTGNQLKITFDSSTNAISESQTHYCAGGAWGSSYFTPSSIELTQLYTTAQYSVYLQKTEATEANLYCDNDIPVFYKTVRHYFSRELPKIKGEYYLTTLHNKKRVFNDEYRISPSAGLVNFNENGTFVEMLTNSEELTGNWQIINNELLLTYQDNISVRYQYIADFYGVPRFLITHIQDGVVNGVSSAYLVKKANITVPQITAGYWYFGAIERPPLDSYLSYSLSRVDFQTENIGNWQTFLSGNEWHTHSGEYGVFTWRIADNRIYHDYYKLDGAGVNYCDVSQDNCYIYNTDEFEVIADINGIYFVKFIYHFFDETGALFGSDSGIHSFKYVAH
ncbi:hypothetical protein tinsulaeT_24050 [Thalassotalea insulae]|uniref:Tandem-95 repeat protein n=1 Tax=Thalassotalea insulae TaxID=2056778 RepID=A0ABQ6GSZ2_9GAMM|nr:cadherin-like domain-containing protein [Thalassotalea insulae]GLX79065.1 hypothetical protein tinsulaeT_24050 [Thalassotalea insulae]